MLVQGKSSRTIWLPAEDPATVCIIDQRHLPHEVVIEKLRTSREAATAIREMHVRGAPLIGATAAFGLYLAAREAAESGGDLPEIEKAAELLKSTRPTAIDLFHAVEGSLKDIRAGKDPQQRVEQALNFAREWCDTSVVQCRSIGEHGLDLIARIHRETQRPVQVLTHCNAGWMACIDYGTATAPIYLAQEKGIPVHVWVDETRPRNQGSRITAFELQEQGVPHTIITDNAGGHLMQHGMVDLVITGTDRTTRQGDVANKIGTYLKALAAKDNNLPFYVALPSSSIDWSLRDGLQEIPIEEREAEEVKYVYGRNDSGRRARVLISPEHSPAANYGFDVTPARLVTALITERGICTASEASLLDLFPEHR